MYIVLWRRLAFSEWYVLNSSPVTFDQELANQIAHQLNRTGEVEKLYAVFKVEPQ